MALSVEVTKPLDQGRVQVDAKNKIFGKDMVTYYSVPKEKADEFIADYKKEHKARTQKGILAGAITAASMVIGGLASKKANVLLKGLSVALFGAAGAVASVVGFGMNNAKRMNKLFEKHNASPMFYLKEEQPAKDKKLNFEAKNEKTEKADDKMNKTEDKKAPETKAKPDDKKVETPKDDVKPQEEVKPKKESEKEEDDD